MSWTNSKNWLAFIETISLLIPLGLTAAASAADAAIHKKMFGSGMATLLISY